VNRWKIPLALEQLVRERDRACVYCRRGFGDLQSPRGTRPSWEHIVNDESLISADNVALCCISCNASKGAKPLRDWLSSTYCGDRGISAMTMAEVARRALAVNNSTFERHD
jgi:hypothetical protein